MRAAATSYQGFGKQFCQRILLSAAFLGLFAGDVNDLFAQGGQVIRTANSRERTREFIDNYSNPWDGNNDFSRPQRPENRYADGQPDPKAIRPLIRTFGDSLSQLTYALNDQMGQIPGLRQAYTEALRLSGTAVGLQKRTENYGFDGSILSDLQQLDADWRELAYRLNNLPGLSGDSQDLIATINDADQRLRQAIRIQPQLDRRQLLLKSAGLVSDLENLQDDVASELGNGSDSQMYRRTISRLRQSVLNLVSIIRDEASDTGLIVEEYKQFESLWSPLVAKLRAEDDRYIERSVRRVSASANEIHQMLLLPQKVDQSQFVYLAKSLKKDIDEFFERTPLILVMSLPRAKQALPVADQFYSACNHFVEVATRSQDLREIADAYQKLEMANRSFNEVFADVDSDRAAAVLNHMAQTIRALRSSLQIPHDDFDFQTASDLAASIQNFTEQIEFVAKRWLDQDRQAFAGDCLQAVADMTDRAERLHDDLLAGKPVSELRAEMSALYENWRQVYAFLVKCHTEDRQNLGRLSANLTPAMIDLRTRIMQ